MGYINMNALRTPKAIFELQAIDLKRLSDIARARDSARAREVNCA